MKIAIVGAGLVGVCTALNLALRGHEVEVFERRSGIATEASFAGSGVMLPVALPSLQPQGWLAQGFKGISQQWRSRRARSTSEWQQRQITLSEIGLISERLLREWTPHFHLDFERAQGLLLLRSAQVTAKNCSNPFSEDEQLLGRLCLPFERLAGEALLQAEPSLALTNIGKECIAQGLYLPQIGALNARQLAQQLRHAAQSLGTRFRLEQEVLGVDAGHGVRLHWRSTPPLPNAVNMPAPSRLSGHGVSDGTDAFDAVVFCSGLGAAAELGVLPRKIPLRAQATCTLTAPLILPEAAPDPGPRGAVVDVEKGVIVTRMGHQRVRLTDPWSSAEPDGRPTAKTQARLYSSLERWFPGAARTSQVQAWQGWRPVLPDAAPILGSSALPNVWLSLGHGDQGNALALGSGAVMADLIEHRTTNLNLDTLSLQRWQ